MLVGVGPGTGHAQVSSYTGIEGISVDVRSQGLSRRFDAYWKGEVEKYLRSKKVPVIPTFPESSWDSSKANITLGIQRRQNSPNAEFYSVQLVARRLTTYPGLGDALFAQPFFVDTIAWGHPIGEGDYMGERLTILVDAFIEQYNRRPPAPVVPAKDTTGTQCPKCDCPVCSTAPAASSAAPAPPGCSVGVAVADEAAGAEVDSGEAGLTLDAEIRSPDKGALGSVSLIRLRAANGSSALFGAGDRRSWAASLTDKKGTSAIAHVAHETPSKSALWVYDPATRRVERRPLEIEPGASYEDLLCQLASAVVPATGIEVEVQGRRIARKGRVRRLIDVGRLTKGG